MPTAGGFEASLPEMSSSSEATDGSPPHSSEPSPEQLAASNVLPDVTMATTGHPSAVPSSGATT